MGTLLIHRFPDNCAQQYKCINAFSYICQFQDSNDIELTHHFTETWHGKRPSDGLGAVVKKRLEKRILGGTVINNAYQAYLALMQSQQDDDLLPEQYRVPAAKRPRAGDVIVIKSSDHGQEPLQDDSPKFDNVNVPLSLSDNKTSGNSLEKLVNINENNPVIRQILLLLNANKGEINVDNVSNKTCEKSMILVCHKFKTVMRI